MNRKYTNRYLITGIAYPGRRGALRDGPDDTGGAGDGGGSGKPANDDLADKDGKGGDGGKTPKLDGDFDPERAMRDLGKARDDAKREKELREKAERDQQEKLDAVLIALGLKPDPKSDPAATAAKVAKELTDAQEKVAELTVENAVLRLAGKAGADVDALLDSTRFRATIRGLDPAAKDFDKSVADAIKDAVKANPKLAAAAPQGSQGPARQGTDISGSGGTGDKPRGLAAAIKARMGQ